ncbi:MAG: asparagine synthase-related protein [Paludibacter sp.]
MKSINAIKSAFSSLLSDDLKTLATIECYVDGKTKLFLNGRFYNSSPEDFLKNYNKTGIEAFKTIDGDFTLILVNTGKLRIFRDRHGVGSQVFYSADFFTSNLLDFTELKGFECKPNKEALLTFLSIGYIPSPLCSLEGVKKLGAGHLLTVDKTSQTDIDIFPASDYLKRVSTTKLTIDEATEEYERLHKKAIKERIGNETKIGLLLSGGYDSGGNISALRDVYDGEISSFSIGFKNNQWTELPLAKILSERYKSSHHDYEIEGSEIMSLPKIIAVTGDPFQEGGLMVNYTAMELVKKSGEKPDLILGGDGNDQHFGTSGKELALHWKMKNNGGQILQKLFDFTGNSSLFENDNILFRSEFHNRKILHIQQSDVFGFTLHQLNKINSVGMKMGEFGYLKEHPKKFNNFDEFFYNRNLNIDIKQVINEVILFKSSRMGELFENNISFPYMSTELYDFLNSLPVDYKFHGTLDELSKGKGASKYLHKKYLKPKLPTEITDRKKQGGFAPLPIFLKDDKQRKLLFTFIRNCDLVKHMFKYKAIDNLLNQYDIAANSKSYWFWFQQVKANQIVNLLTLAVWWEMLINKKTKIQSITELF